MRIREILFVLGLSGLATTAVSQQPATAAPPAADPADVGSLDAIMKAVYDVISGPAGAPRNWNRMRSLFIPAARLGPIARGPDGRLLARMGTLEDWIAGARTYFDTAGFYEREIARTVETYGHLTHLFSTYESRHAPIDAAPFARGINSFQLLNDGTRWWVVSIYWEAERPDNAIPPRYLPRKSG